MKKSALRTSFTALFAAIICVGCLIKIPLGVIPVVLQNMLCILCAVLLGGIWAGIPTALFLLAGLIGLPVYSGGSGGIAVWLGPTGGFLPGYLLGAVASGFIASRPSVEEKKITLKNIIRISLAIIAGMVLLYIPGVIRFSYWATAAGKVPVEKTALTYTLTACVIPYIPGDILKTVIAVLVALKLRPVVAQYLYEDENTDKD
ncbi:MAG: biotin transporter BioY [Treponema sp.]|nr:biotin transporter BioY [Treponema sp.]